MAFCTSCGQPLRDGAAFCAACGTNQRAGAAPNPIKPERPASSRLKQSPQAHRRWSPCRWPSRMPPLR